MKLDRSLQLRILKSLSDAYPVDLRAAQIDGYSDGELPKFMANMFYLKDHDLLEAISKTEIAFSAQPMIYDARITAKGIDFLADDGGLSAILNKVVVKLDPDDLCKLLSLRIDQLKIEPDKKDSILSSIKALPADTLRKVYIRLIEYGLDKAPDAYQLLQTFLEKSP